MKPKVHMTFEPEPEAREILAAALESTADLSFGEKAPQDTQILINGRLRENPFGELPLCQDVIVPFAGLQPNMREVMRETPRVRVHNLHHNFSMTAEMAMALLLACARRIVPLHNEFSHDNWEPRYFNRDALSLYGKTAVVLGWGAIGKHIGQCCRAFGMKVVGVKTQADGEIHGIDELHELLPKADYLIVTLPLTDETEGLIGAEELALLPVSAIVVNVGRGKVIDERALFEALRDQKIDSAGIDVWYQYPKDAEDKTSPSEYPFGSLPNVVMTPHIGGGTQDTEPIRMKALAELVKAILDGDIGKNLVNVERGY